MGSMKNYMPSGLNKAILAVLLVGGLFLPGMAKDIPINYKYRNQTHPVTGVPYNRNGRAVFDSKYDYKLPVHLYREKNEDLQFKRATQALRKRIQRDPVLKKQFTKEQLQQIRRGAPRIDGYSWHHNQRQGILQLVDRDIHNKTAHTGGRITWGSKSSRATSFAKKIRISSIRASGLSRLLGTTAKFAGRLGTIGLVASVAAVVTEASIEVYKTYKQVGENKEDIAEVKGNVQLNTQYIDRLLGEQEILGIKIDENTYNISELTKQLVYHSGQFDLIDQKFQAVDNRFSALTAQMVDVQTLVNKNIQAIQEIKDGVYITGVQKFNEYYDTHDTDYLDEAITELDKTKNIHNTKVEPLAVHYLVIARYEKYLDTGNAHEMDEVKKNFRELTRYIGKNPDYLGLLSNAYAAISDLDEEVLKLFRDQLDKATEKAINQKISAGQFDKAMYMAENYISITNTDDSYPLYKKTLKAKKVNYEAHKNFTSIGNVMKIVSENQNSLLNEAAVKYLYKEDSLNNALTLLRTKRFDNDEFRVKAIALIYYLDKNNRSEELKALVKLILDNPTYTEEIKKQIREKICDKKGSEKICEGV